MWIDRSLLQGPRVAVVTSQRQYLAVLRSIDYKEPDEFCPARMLACVHSFEAAGELVCVVGINLPRTRAMDSIDVAALLVHEAVHVWQRTRDAIGADGVGRELEAYAVQNIAAGIMRAYVKASSSVAAAVTGP
jgi:hypothetical protein